VAEGSGEGAGEGSGDGAGRGRVALATLVVGDKYREAFERRYLPGWVAYARRHGYDLHVVDRAIDGRADLARKSLHWQKMLVPSLPQLRGYDRVVWVDADVMINAAVAPDVTAGVPADRIGVVDATPWMTAPDDAFTQYGRFLLLDALSMTARRRHGVDYDRIVIADMTVADMYRLKGFDPPVDRFVNTGVFVCTPREHADFLFEAYLRHDRDVWDFENSALSWEIVRSGLAHWIDPRFNAVWPWEAARHYPFLYDLGFQHANPDLLRMCVNTVFRNNWFLHLAGANSKPLAGAVDAAAENLAALVIPDYARRREGIDLVPMPEAQAALAAGGRVEWPF
jgi:hypothetical protein